MRWWIPVLAVGCSYSPGSFGTYYVGPFAGHRAVVGCLDVALDRPRDVEGAPVIDYSFGNRCGRPVVIDFSRVTVIGRTSTGEEIALRPFDPTQELRPLPIDGRFAGREAIAYPTTTPLAQVCVDVATIAIDDGKKEAHWMCFASKRPAEPTREPAADELGLGDDRTTVDQGEAIELLHEERSL